MKKFFWTITILWIAIIFYFSHQPGNISSMQSGKVLEKMDLVTMDQVVNHDRSIRNLQLMIRKTAHFTVYFILGVFLTLTFKVSNFNRYSIKSFFTGTLYAVFDEIHQYFIPGRDMMILDMLIDSIGILVGVCFVMLVVKYNNSLRDRHDISCK